MQERPLEFFVALETRVWDALKSGDAEADRELLSPDFVGVYPSGFADRSDHAAQLVDGPSVGSYDISDTRLIRVSDAAVILCYRAVYCRLGDGLSSGPHTMYVSSVWTERDGRWSNTFSQDTPAEVTPPAA
jgi:hypothetical protein